MYALAQHRAGETLCSRGHAATVVVYLCSLEPCIRSSRVAALITLAASSSSIPYDR
jgi:hypothetical protein